MSNRVLLPAVGLAALTLTMLLPFDVWGRGGGVGGRGGFGGGAPGHGGGFTGGARPGPGGFGGGQMHGGAGGGFASGGAGGRGTNRMPGGGTFGSGNVGQRGATEPGFGNRGGGAPGFERHEAGRGPGAGGPGFKATGSGGRGFGSPEAGRDRYAAPDRKQLDGFLGLPSDQGMHGLGGAGRTTSGQAPADRRLAQTSPRDDIGPGQRLPAAEQRLPGAEQRLPGAEQRLPGAEQRLPAAGQRAADGRALADRGGFDRWTPSQRYAGATAVRNNFNHWDLYGRDWYGRYPGAWHAAGWAAGAAWTTASWATAAAYCGSASQQPVYYDYGSNVTYDDNSVHVDGTDMGSAQQYYQQAQDLASAGASDTSAADGDWLPLGVFALTKPDHTQSKVSIQLAVNKQGDIRGNYTDTATNKNQLIQGSVDKQTQRVAFHVGDHQQNIIETGLYNLTKDEAPCLVHVGQDHTEQWLLVRMERPDNVGAG